MVIQERDTRLLNFLDEFKVAKTSTLIELFYPSYHVATRRLSQLTKNGDVKRERGGWSSEYYYYLKKPKHFRHSLLLTEFYRELHKIADIKHFIVEPKFGNIRPDGIVGYTLNGKNHFAMVEVEISHKGFNSEKYNNFDWQSFLKYEPELIVISDYRSDCKRYKTYKIKTNMDLSPLKN